jgi:hypothetical protein
MIEIRSTCPYRGVGRGIVSWEDGPTILLDLA